MDEVIHIAADRFGPDGELFRSCDGGPLAPLPPERSQSSRNEAGYNIQPAPIRFCRTCVAVARLVGAKPRS